MVRITSRWIGASFVIAANTCLRSKSTAVSSIVVGVGRADHGRLHRGVKNCGLPRVALVWFGAQARCHPVGGA